MPDFWQPTTKSTWRSAIDLMVLERVKSIADRQVLFVVGCQKSGTTWLQHLLNGHPQVACGGEGHLADRLAPLVPRLFRDYVEVDNVSVALAQTHVDATTRFLADQVLATYLAAAPDPDAVRVVGDRTPESAVALPLLDTLYPTARFVHIIRDGRDGTVSGWAHLQRQNRAGQFASFAEYAHVYAGAVWAGYIGRARHAAAQFPDRYLELRYEDLHENPAEEMGRLLEFLAVDAGEAAVAQCLEAGSFERLSGGRRRGEEDAGSHFRKGVVGDWREHFDEEAIARFEAAAGPLRKDLGYPEPCRNRSFSGPTSIPV